MLQGFADLQSFLVVCGCLLLIGIISSTLSAHSTDLSSFPRPPASAVASTSRSELIVMPWRGLAVISGNSSPVLRQKSAAVSIVIQAIGWLATMLPFVMAIANVPLQPRREGDPLRVLIIGRISTPHQREEAIQASYRFVEDHLRRVYKGPLEITHLGEQASGMKVDRETIRRAEDMIEFGEIDVVMAEDLSRIFRNPRHQMNFVQDAVDAGIRVICIADNLDTADENWELMLGTAGLRHGLVVTDTRRRVRNNATDSFRKGGMVQKVRFGYRKLSKEEAVGGQFGPVGLRLAKDPICTPVILKMRQMVLDGLPYSAIAQCLNRQEIKPGRYSKKGKWTAKLVIDTLRNPIIHGERTFRDTMYQAIFRTGAHRRLRNSNPERAVYPELVHLTMEEHAELLNAMDVRADLHRHLAGKEHPRFRLPRSKAIWPAQHITCSICGSLMYATDKGQFKCSRTFVTGAERCWNRVLVKGEQVRKAVIPWLLAIVSSHAEARTAFFDECWREAERLTSESGSELLMLQKRIRELEQQAERLAQAIAEGGELPALVKHSRSIVSEIAVAQARAGQLQSQAQQPTLPVDRDAFEADPLPALLELARNSFEFSELMKRMVTDISVVPVQDILHGQVRPRVKATVQFDQGDGTASLIETKQFDAFELPMHISQIAPICEIRQQEPNCSRARLAELLCIAVDAIKRPLKYLKLMTQHGLNDPFVELVARPENASRWRDDADNAA